MTLPGRLIALPMPFLFLAPLAQQPVPVEGGNPHLHQHIVPRWANDANFFPIIAKTKAMPQLLGDLREAIAVAWADPPD